MNPSHPVDEQLLLDYVFGLLEPAEAERVEGYLVADPQWQAAHAELTKFESLLNVATRGDFSEVRFTPPTAPTLEETLVEAKSRAQREVDPDRGVGYGIWMRYVVMASLFLAVCGLGIPTLFDLGGMLIYHPEVAQKSREVDESNREVAARQQDFKLAQDRINQQLAQERLKVRSLFTEWLEASRQERKAQVSAAYTVAVRGPVSAVPGQPNEYALLLNRKPSPDPVPDLTAEVKTSSGEVVYRTTLPSSDATERKLTIPAMIWDKLSADSGLLLDVLAKDPATGKLSSVRVPVNLYEPTYTTFLSTDKPLYKPGEAIYFRSLTLERSRFLPPEQEQTLQFELLASDGKRVPGLDPVLGRTRPVRSNLGGFRPVIGPDGQPVQGIGSGVFILPDSLPGGAYKLIVTEANPSGFVPPNARPLAVRKIIVAGYNPDRFQKDLTFDASSYGPGEKVRVKISVRDQVRSVNQAKLQLRLEADGEQIAIADSATDDLGQAALEFQLPKKADLQRATLTTRISSNGVVETLVRPIRLRTAQLKLEFFPEGGELIAGVENRVYFRATTLLGEPADLSGYVTDGLNKLASFRTLTDAEHPGVNQGHGVFRFTPQAGQRYAVVLTSPQGVTQPRLQPIHPAAAATLGVIATPTAGYLLPKSVTSGVALQVQAVSAPGQPLEVRLANQGKDRQLIIGVYVRGRPLAHERLTMPASSQRQLKIDLGTSTLGGVTRVTVFEEIPGQADLLPIAERLVYRQPGQSLNLKLEGIGEKPFTPGDVAQLRVQAHDERGQPTSAILWAAVVNQSVLSQANDKTERLLPTHFLLNGELDNGESLENADFLLTDHPQARVALDLLLGTQGWRRFVPAAKKTPDAFLAMASTRSLMPDRGTQIRTRPALRTVFDDYWPKYEEAATRLDQLERDVASGEATRQELQSLQLANGNLTRHQSELRLAAKDVWFFQERLESRLLWLPLSLIMLGSMISIVIVTRMMIADGPLRRWLSASFVILVLLIGILILGAVLPILVDNRWKAQTPDVVKNTQEFLNVGYSISGGKSPAPPTATNQLSPKMAAPQPAPAFGPERLPAQAAPFALGALDNPPEPEANQLEPNIPFTPRQRRGRGTDRFLPIAEPSPAARRLQASLLGLSDLDKSAFLGVPQAAPLVVRSYAHDQSNQPSGLRNNFAETLLWEPIIITSPSEPAELRFQISDNLNSYRVLVAGHTLDGRLGAITRQFEVRKPFAVEPKMPLEICSTDKLQIPLIVTNGGPGPVRATIRLNLTGLQSDVQEERVVQAPVGTSRTIINLEPTIKDGVAKLQILAATDDGTTDNVTRELRVVPDGFLIEGTSNLMLERQARVMAKLPTWIPGTLKANVTVYPNTLTELQSGLEGLIREPHGCFEQASSSNYPNILVLDYLRDHGWGNTESAQTAQLYLQKGYSKLTSYECPKTGSPTRMGFEWFGAADRQHEALTAYGLLQFSDMSRVFPVDDALLRRTKQFLLDSRDGEGGFRRNSATIDRFGGAPTHITNAYIVWAITESEKAGQRSDLEPELNALLKLAKVGHTSQDSYFLALLANALHNVGRVDEAITLLKTLASSQIEQGMISGAKTSITRSTGRDLLIETTALTVLGWMKADRFDLFGTRIPLSISWLSNQRSPSGAFGSTQATVLAMKALVEYARRNQHPVESGRITLNIQGIYYTSSNFNSNANTPLTIPVPNVETTLRTGFNNIRVESNTKQAYPMSLVWSARTLQPDNSPDNPLSLEAKLSATTVSEGDSVRLNLTLKNRQDKSQGMAVAVIGLPAGLKLPEDRQELIQLSQPRNNGDEPTISHWQTNGRELILYWRGLAGNQTVNVTLTLIAEIPGHYRGAASRAYLYYGADQKTWLAPLDVDIAPR